MISFLNTDYNLSFTRYANISVKLGAKSLRILLLYQNSQNVELEFSKQYMEAFGQQESITNRIRNILQLYPEGNLTLPYVT